MSFFSSVDDITHDTNTKYIAYTWKSQHKIKHMFTYTPLLGMYITKQNYYHLSLEKYHDTIYITIFYVINIHNEISLCLLHESQLGKS